MDEIVNEEIENFENKIKKLATEELSNESCPMDIKFAIEDDLTNIYNQDEVQILMPYFNEPPKPFGTNRIQIGGGCDNIWNRWAARGLVVSILAIISSIIYTICEIAYKLSKNNGKLNAEETEGIYKRLTAIVATATTYITAALYCVAIKMMTESNVNYLIEHISDYFEKNNKFHI